MAITRTSLAAASSAIDNSFTVTSATGATVKGFILVDNELSWITSIVGTVIYVRHRGAQGGRAVAHNILAPVTFGLASDLPDAFRGAKGGVDDVEVLSVGADGAIPLPTKQKARVIITKGSAAALTLADPTNLPDGVDLEIQSATAFAHTVTLTAGFFGNTTTTDVATFVAGIGNGFKVVAIKGKWGAPSAGATVVGVTFA